MATLRGRGSLFIDPALGIESPEPMHLYIEHTRLDALQNAKQLARNLIETLQQELAHFQQMNPPGPAPAPVPSSGQNIQYTQQPVQNMQSTHTQVSKYHFPTITRLLHITFLHFSYRFQQKSFCTFFHYIFL